MIWIWLIDSKCLFPTFVCFNLYLKMFFEYINYIQKLASWIIIFYKSCSEKLMKMCLDFSKIIKITVNPFEDYKSQMYCQRQFCFIEVKHFANTYNTLYKKRNYLSTLQIHTIPFIRNATVRLFYSCGRRKGDNLLLGSTTNLITGPSVAS